MQDLTTTCVKNKQIFFSIILSLCLSCAQSADINNVAPKGKYSRPVLDVNNLQEPSGGGDLNELWRLIFEVINQPNDKLIRGRLENIFGAKMVEQGYLPQDMAVIYALKTKDPWATEMVLEEYRRDQNEYHYVIKINFLSVRCVDYEVVEKNIIDGGWELVYENKPVVDVARNRWLVVNSYNKKGGNVSIHTTGAMNLDRKSVSGGCVVKVVIQK